MGSTAKIKLTRDRISKLPAPKKGEVTVWDADVGGLGVRCLASGARSYIVTYRVGYGRAASKVRRITLGPVAKLRLEDARMEALAINADVMRGLDPMQERRDAAIAKVRSALLLSTALAKYDSDMELRGVKRRKSILSVLNRHLLGHIGDVPLDTIDRRIIVSAIEALKERGLLGAADGLRSQASTFLTWSANQGLIESNPLSGYRTARKTRDARSAKKGRALEDAELAAIWVALDAPSTNPAFRGLVRILILAGQRRTETARMKWSDLNEDLTIWTIPAPEAKNGLAHDVPITDQMRSVILSAPKWDGCEFVFSTNGRSAISGWSKLSSKLADQVSAVWQSEHSGSAAAPLFRPWTMHDLRRTFRTGLTRLGVSQDVAELMINHVPETLRSIYDRSPQMEARVNAAKRWSDHLAGTLRPTNSSNVISINEV